MRCSAVGVIVAFTLSLLAAPLATDAQPSAHLPKVGWLDWGGRADKAHLQAAFLQGLRELGYVEGQNLVLTRRDAEGQLDQLPALAVELVRLPVDVIVTASGVPATGRPYRRLRPFPSSWRKPGMRWGRASSPAWRDPAGTSRGCP